MKVERVIENANKLTYLKTQYPDHKVPELLALMQMPSIDTNVALWYAVEQGWLGEPDKETASIALLEPPKEWNFGQFQNDLQEMLVYSFGQIAKNETDIEEHYLSSWTEGYPSHEIFVALKRLLETDVLTEYEIEDGANKYLFYTLTVNKDKLWGRKQFKEDPLTERKKGKK